MRPWPPQQPPARRPQAHLHQPAGGSAPSLVEEISRPKPHRPESLCTLRQVHPRSVPAGVLSSDPHAAPAGHTRPTPQPNLLVRVCFFGHFPVHLDACPAAGSFAPFIFLSAHPPSSHLRRSPDLVGEGGAAQGRRGSRTTEAPGGLGEGVQRQAAGIKKRRSAEARGGRGLRGLGSRRRGRGLDWGRQ